MAGLREQLRQLRGVAEEGTTQAALLKRHLAATQNQLALKEAGSASAAASADHENAVLRAELYRVKQQLHAAR